MAFSHVGYFPFCIKTVQNVGEENERYNNAYQGFSGFGRIYPVGMTLTDAMALYWKTDYINWDFFASWSLGTDCVIDSERNGVGPFYPLGYPQDSELQKMLMLRTCGGDEEDIKEGLERYSLRFNGPVRYYVERTGSDEDCGVEFAGTDEEQTDESVFNCFFVPKPTTPFDPDPIEEQERDFARILYHESTNLYYPAMLAYYWGYSRLFINQKFVSSQSSYESESFEAVPLNINDNTYEIAMVQVFNYTPDPPWDGYTTGEINCTLL